jgi:hypothetical protein
MAVLMFHMEGKLNVRRKKMCNCNIHENKMEFLKISGCVPDIKT